MRHFGRLRFVILIVAILGCMSTIASAQTAPDAKSPSSTLKVGDKAPDFELPDQNRKMVKLSNFKGKKNVVLAFYVFAFTGG